MKDSAQRFDPVVYPTTMETFKSLEGLMVRLANAQTQPELSQVLEAFALEHDFQMAGQLLVHRTKRLSCSTSHVNYGGEKINEAYIQQGMGAIDPCVKRALREHHPIPWGLAHHRTNPNNLEKKIWKFHHETGTQRGIICPTHSLEHSAILGLTHNGSESDFLARLPTLAPMIHVFSVMLTYAMTRIERPETTQTSNVQGPLTNRERDCLSWAAEGKTAWETSVILGIAETTIIFHIENAKKKLGASTTTHAVAIALKNQFLF